MTYFKPTAGPTGGLEPLPIKFKGVYNRTGGAVAANDIVMFDLTSADAASTSEDPGAAKGTSIYQNVIKPVVTGTSQSFPCALVLTGGADDAEIEVLVYGMATAKAIKASGNIAIGDRLVADVNMNVDGTSAVGERFVAIARQALTTPTTRTDCKVFFNGWGFGADVGS